MAKPVTITIDGIEVPEEVVERVRLILIARLGRRVGNKELGDFIAQVLQGWADNMDTLIGR